MNVGVHWEGGGQGSQPPAGDPRSRLAETRSGDRPRDHAGTSHTEIAVFDAAERLLADKSLHELSVAEIIAAAGISRATFYFYFSSKFAVLSGLVARVSDEIFDVARPFVQRRESVDPQVALRDSLTAAVKLWHRHEPAMRAIHEHWNTTEQLRSLWISVMQRFTEAVTAEIERQRQAGLARDGCDSRLLCSALLWSTAQCLYVAGLGLDADLSDEQAALRALYALWCSALYGS